MILAIETSCDDSALALIDRQGQVVFEALSSQIDWHAKFGGVVPEIASRKHLVTLPLMMEHLRQERGLDPADLSAVAVTQAPGLVGSVLVGLSWAKALAWSWNLPLVPVDHLEGHLLAPFLDHPQLDFPYLALIASGGHTHLVWAEGLGEYKLLGKTLDDALGEAYDKVAKMLGFAYPGGPIIDRIAQESESASIQFPIPFKGKKTFNFSFSGLKTAVRNEAEARKLRVEKKRLLGYADYLNFEASHRLALADIAASFQNCVAQIVTERFEQALGRIEAKRLVLTGGVAANSGIRAAMMSLAQRRGLELYYPSRVHCTDNAAMIGRTAWAYLQAGRGKCEEPLSLGASAKSALGLMEVEPEFL
ncbi:MAG: tRNA (adenosine(37)-N6)-threonylcarbamoyltransferase complex transferase subunit TsaD [bacterium]|nr:tRNA (adenosine(37)-N6)-threonylcarbamoyltransferase complex transferase subunit TsaD [bacterium]